MMIEVAKSVDVGKLHEELAAVGVRVLTVRGVSLEPAPAPCYAAVVVVEDGQDAKTISDVVAAHDPGKEASAPEAAKIAASVAALSVDR